MTLFAEIIRAGASRYTPWKRACRVGVSANVATLSGEGTHDSTALVQNDRIFLAAQTNQVQNGPWVVKQSAWERPSDFDDRSELLGAVVLVAGGTLAGTWQLTSPTTQTIRLGLDSLVFTPMTDMPVVTHSANGELQMGYMNYLTGAITAMTLPDPTAGQGMVSWQKVNIAGAITISPFAAETINGAATLSATGTYGKGTLVTDRTNWFG